jgi:hypothetical protein
MAIERKQKLRPRRPTAPGRGSKAVHEALRGKIIRTTPSIFCGKEWRAKIYYDGKLHWLGTFSTKQEAALAYDRKATRQCGEDKLLNYESIAAAEGAAAAAATSAYALETTARFKPHN